jgi:hypothetical protein
VKLCVKIQYQNNINYGGSSLLDQPVLALVYLRYAIEWQLWYKALNSEKGYFYVMAALEVTRFFITYYLKTIKKS